jgi:hypothetical protein
MILHKLLFLHLPYGDTDDFDALHAEILRYPGCVSLPTCRWTLLRLVTPPRFIPTPELIESCERRHIPRDLLLLLSKLVNVNPEERPTAERVRTAIRGLVSDDVSDCCQAAPQKRNGMSEVTRSRIRC